MAARALPIRCQRRCIGNAFAAKAAPTSWLAACSAAAAAVALLEQAIDAAGDVLRSLHLVIGHALAMAR
ncbi:hypothetical protein TR80_021770 [Xanthomonas campestris]|nr:hypothetical protein TR80_021770 [Xanthomonas campestris]